MKTVKKKTLPEYYREVSEGRKKFEIRKDEDRLEPGDIVILEEWNGKYTGKRIGIKISYILRDAPEFGLVPGYCIFCWE